MQDLGADEMLGAALAGIGLRLGRRLEHDRAKAAAVARATRTRVVCLGLVQWPSILACAAAGVGVLADHRANIVETSYDRTYYGVNLGETAIDITMETRGPEQIAELLAALAAAGYSHERIL